jgi:DNA-3-methyladenine glycosylase
VRVAVTTRIGLSREQHRPLRFFAAGSPYVSGPRKLLGGAAAPIRARRESRD